MTGTPLSPEDALDFVRREGIVLQSARGRVPSLAEAIAGEPIRGSWWGHPAGRAIFRAAQRVVDSDEVLVCPLLDGKVTYVHRRIWPALVRLASRLPADSLAEIGEEHTPSGQHERRVTPFPDWVPEEVRAEAARLSEDEAARQLAAWAWLLDRPSRVQKKTSRGRRSRA